MFELALTVGGLGFVKLWLMYQSNPVSAISTIKFLATTGSIAAWEILHGLGIGS